jgi:STE24 endopeptidase
MIKTLAWLTISLFVLLFLVTTFVPYPPAHEQAKAYFTDQEIDAGLQYTFERRFFFWAGTALDLGLLGVLALTSLSRRGADRLLTWTGQRRIMAVLGMGLLYLILREILYLPLGVARLYHAKAWGMSNYDLVGWLSDHTKALGVEAVMGAIVLIGLYALLIEFPRLWWLLAAVGASLLGMAFAFLAPLLIAPLFNKFTPLSETEWSDQQPRVRALIDKVGIPVQDILVMNASRQSNHTNAYFTGFGSTRRIVLYDNLLKKHTPDEIESILAHELGHWLHDHIVKGILIGALAAVVGFFLLDRVLRYAVGRSPWQLRSIADPAGLPFILLLMTLGSWVAMPVGNAISRHFERQADEVSLDLAGQPEAFIECEKKLARDNLGNVAPTPWNVWLFATHPPTVERIRMAEEWRDRRRRVN